MEPLRLLVFVGTEGVHHDHVGNGKSMAAMLSNTEDIKADISQDYEVLANGLHPYGVVVFYTDVGTLTESQEKNLLSFIARGGGFFGLHTAAASFRESKGITICSMGSLTAIASTWTSPSVSSIRMTLSPRGLRIFCAPTNYTI